MENIDLVFLFVLAAFVGYYMCKKESFEGLEGFAAIDDARQAVREIYNADIDAIRNLSTVATKLQAGGLTVPGVMKTNKINLTNDKWENNHEGNAKSYVVNDDGNYKKLMLVGNDSGGGGIRRVGMWDDVEISRHLQVNGNITAGGDMNVGSGRTIASQGRLHITGAELLYLLNKNGVVIGKEWGGNGNLSVQGDTSVNGKTSFGGPMSDGIVNIRNRDGRYSHFNWTDGQNYIRGNTIVDGNMNVNGQLCIDDVCINKNHLRMLRDGFYLQVKNHRRSDNGDRWHATSPIHMHGNGHMAVAPMYSAFQPLPL